MHDNTQNRPQPAFDRRQVLRAGAWAAPVIAVAAAVPAASASVVNGTLVFNSMQAQYIDDGQSNWTTVQVFGSVRLSAGTGSADSITLVVTVGNADGQLAVDQPPTFASDSDPAWTSAGPGQVNGSNVVYTFVWPRSVAVNENTELIRANLPGNGIITGGRDWSVTASTPGATSVTQPGVLAGRTADE